MLSLRASRIRRWSKSADIRCCTTQCRYATILDVEALNYGWTTRFISHACDPNTAFAEMENRTNVKVLIKMIKNVKPGAQITVNYGPERWFKSTCDACWLDQEQEQRS
ncbi:SET domain [Phytophthora cactorum]|nr:SET domain [Phytophthora cactorum]